MAYLYDHPEFQKLKVRKVWGSIKTSQCATVARFSRGYSDRILTMEYDVEHTDVEVIAEDPHDVDIWDTKYSPLEAGRVL